MFSRSGKAVGLSIVMAACSCGALAVGNAPRDCIDQAAAYHHVNPVVLRAMAWHESRMKSWVIGKNKNGSYDIGLMQINSIHLAELAKFGIGPQHLTDACVSAYVGAWKYRIKVNKHGNTWTAVGAYHSETPVHRDAYAAKIAAIVRSWTAVK